MGSAVQLSIFPVQPFHGVLTGGAMGSADEVNIQASELNRTMKVVGASPGSVVHNSKEQTTSYQTCVAACAGRH